MERFVPGYWTALCKLQMLQNRLLKEVSVGRRQVNRGKRIREWVKAW